MSDVSENQDYSAGENSVGQDESQHSMSDALENQGTKILENETEVKSNQERITPRFLTKYEKARVIGTRAM